jgi:hypothetical protein
MMSPALVGPVLVSLMSLPVAAADSIPAAPPAPARYAAATATSPSNAAAGAKPAQEKAKSTGRQAAKAATEMKSTATSPPYGTGFEARQRSADAARQPPARFEPSNRMPKNL